MIKIGKAIYSILSANSVITGYTGNNIFPLVIPENTVLPCIVYERNSDIEYTRDGAGVFTSYIDITILSENYAESIDITQSIYDALDEYSGTVAGIRIIKIRLESINETFAENAYIQKLTYSVMST